MAFCRLAEIARSRGDSFRITREFLNPTALPSEEETAMFTLSRVAAAIAEADEDWFRKAIKRRLKDARAKKETDR